MPQVKIAYVVSFSSEDPENQARNLLSSEESKRRWLCARGESSASAVLQLERAVTISAVHIGAHQAALVEVLVARSESPTEPFQVLVPSSVFLTPRESRGGPGVPGAPRDRVRLFEGAALAEGARSQRWDRVRIVCSQPYNKHCKYGISFINIFEPAGAPAPVSPPVSAPAVPPRISALDTFSSDEDEFRPGELFAKLRQSASDDTGAQIRQATSQALKNNLDAATKLVKVHLSKNKPTATAANADCTELQHTQRDKDNLMYTEDDERPHAKIDHIVQRHKEDNKTSKDVANTPKPKERDKIEKKTSRSKKEEPSGSGYSEGKRDRDRSDSGKERSDNNRRTESSDKGKDESRKRSYEDRNARGSSPAELPLSGVLFVMSGYENPERARLRDLALSLGARASRDWGPACTHLICAFANTPKLRAVRAGRGGAGVPCVRGAWLRACARAGRRVPWRPHAVDEDPRAAQHDEHECDTDDEIEKVLRQGKKPRAASPSPRRASPSPRTPDAKRGSDDDEVEFVKDERMQGNITIEESDEAETDAEARTGARERISAAATLPALFAGRSFVLETSLLGPLDAPLLARYCRAYGGLVLTPSEVDSESGPHYELCASLPTASSSSTSASGTVRVRADWVWECHAARKLLPLDDYV